MKMSLEQYENHLMRLQRGSRPLIQELKEDCQIRQAIRAYNRPRKEKEDAGDGKTVQIECVFRVSDKRKRDLDGMMATVMDCLVEAKLIEDDNIYIVEKLTGSWERCEKGSEGVKVKIIGGL